MHWFANRGNLILAGAILVGISVIVVMYLRHPSSASTKRKLARAMNLPSPYIADRNQGLKRSIQSKSFVSQGRIPREGGGGNRFQALAEATSGADTTTAGGLPFSCPSSQSSPPILTLKNQMDTMEIQIFPDVNASLAPKKNVTMLARVSNLPASFTWQAVSGHKLYPTLSGNYCTAVQNQHVPSYCGSCFIFSSLQALGDRFNIMQAIQNKGMRKADVELAAQQLLNCLPDMTCLTGGDSYLVYNWVLANGIVDQTCKPYTSAADSSQCTPACYTCMPVGDTSCSAIGETTPTNFGTRCCAVDKPPTYQIDGFSNLNNRYAADWGGTAGDANFIEYVKNEIYRYGPITTAMDAIPVEAWKGGAVFVNPDPNYPAQLNHLVCIVGWVGNAWIIRNSWGTAWADAGFFTIRNDQCGLDMWAQNDLFAAYPKGWCATVGGCQAVDVQVTTPGGGR